MNSLVIALCAIIPLILAYLFYGRILDRILSIDPKRPTPAYSRYDSVDYIPAKNWLVLFGHHFSSIAGAGPIIGPVIAVMLWGWLPALLWVILGTIFIGGVHDFGSLAISVKEGGVSVADIAGNVISRRAKKIFALFVWLALVLVIAVFAYLCADTFIKEPKIVLPSLGVIPVAVLVGFFLYNPKFNSVFSTVLGLLLFAILIYLGAKVPIHGGLSFWIILLSIYCYLASVLPVNILLQPRDYLSSFLLFFGLLGGYLGVLLLRPQITLPAYTRFSSSQGELWPSLFVIVACGAVSGFHSLVASGTSSKQIANERYIRRIGYGGMAVEAAVAVLAIISVAVVFGAHDDLGAILKSAGPIGIFGSGYGMLTKKFLGAHGEFIAITMLNAFILTTLDTATRICRYLTEELFGIKNRFFATIVVIIPAGALALSGKWQKIWPAFGASNQLVAALALFVLSCWLLSKKKPVMATLIPAFFMLATTLASLFLQAASYFKGADMILFSVCAILILLAGFMLIEVIRVFSKRGADA